jgi:acylaminoacyl-peptidase
MRITDLCKSLFLVLITLFPAPAFAQVPAKDRLQLKDVFALQWASDPQIRPDGVRVVYVRNFFDIMTDRQRSNLWTISIIGDYHEPLTTGSRNDSMPRWSPECKRLAYVSDQDGPAIYCRWMDTGQTARLARLPAAPTALVWSPDGKQIAFSMFVAQKARPFVELPEKPKGAKWADPPKVITKVNYRFDGKGYLPDGYYHLFVLPADGGAPRQVTTGSFHHTGAPAWTKDSQSLIFAANRNKDWEYQPKETELYEIRLADGKIGRLTSNPGPDTNPVLSPDGKRIAYLTYQDRHQGYQVTRLAVLNFSNGESTPGDRLSIKPFDRDISHPVWPRESKSIYFQYDDLGIGKVGRVTSGGEVETLVDNVGGTTLDRPYSGGSFSAANNGSLAYTLTSPDHPADVAVLMAGAKAPTRLTRLNDSFLGSKKLGKLEEIWYTSSHDGRKVQGWVLKPPGFDPKKKYPLILEIHGGPFANYGPRFSVHHQLYAAAGYVVFYANPRGSTSYGEEFGNLIHHAYPGNDYDDLMSGVDAVLKRGYIDEKNLFVTGGSGGGVLTAWIIGKTRRFRAAVVSKPVINWYSFVLTADLYPFFTEYWFPGPPWENAEHYLKRSPLSLVGNVTTPTMLLTGEADHRTPMSESEQYYQALKLRKVETVLVRIPGASHNISARPSQMMAQVACVLQWFDGHRQVNGN